MEMERMRSVNGSGVEENAFPFVFLSLSIASKRCVCFYFVMQSFLQDLLIGFLSLQHKKR